MTSCRRFASLRAASSGADVCERLEYLETRALCLLQRMSDDEMTRETSPHMATFIDSVALNNVVEEEIEIEYNGKTEHWIDYFQGAGRKHFSRWLARVGSFRDIIEPILVDVGIPRDLLYLAVIESGLNLSAKSYMKAIGPWQFMSGTGKLFGLRINWWLDERKDIVAATYAAANYLKYLHDLFGSWPLALAAYNSGEHRVARAITNQRTTDYWQLRLPAQTTWFVPKFMAALAIGRNPEAYGFVTPPCRSSRIRHHRDRASDRAAEDRRGGGLFAGRDQRAEPPFQEMVHASRHGGRGEGAQGRRSASAATASRR